MASVVILSIPRQQFSHDGGDAVLAAFKQKMHVVVHEDPGIDPALSFDDILSETFQKARLVLIVVEHVGLIIPRTMI